MRLRRATLLTALCAVLGAITSVGLAVGLAWARTPVNSFGGETVAVGRPPQPFVMGSTTIVAYWWTFQDQRRFGERTLSWMSGPSPEEYPDPLTGRPSIGAPFDWFFDHKYLPNRADRSLNRRSINVARAFGWPLPCLWEGETVDGMNAGLKRWPWNGPSYGGIRIANTPAMGHFLPTLPLWPGLTADTTAYGTAWLGLLLLVGPARRAWRRRRGLCVHCRYDLRGLPPGSTCPECGRAARQPQMTQTTPDA